MKNSDRIAAVAFLIFYLTTLIWLTGKLKADATEASLSADRCQVVQDSLQTVVDSLTPFSGDCRLIGEYAWEDDKTTTMIIRCEIAGEGEM